MMSTEVHLAPAPHRLSLENVFLSRRMTPPNESREARAARLQTEDEALQVSRMIDASLLPTKQFLEKRKAAVKILLLGQAESGKSSFLKHFQITFTPTQFNKERPIWRKIIQLNLIRHVKIILHTLQKEFDSPQTRSSSHLGTSPITLSKEHKRIFLSLSPLLQVDDNLGQGTSSLNLHGKFPQYQEIQVRAGSDWKSTLDSAERLPDAVPQFDPTPMLQNSQDDIVALWTDPIIRQLLKKRSVHLEDMSGFFLDDTRRIVASDYVPTDSDVIRARVRTMGVEEHYFVVERDLQKTGCKFFFVTDVAGHRSARASWAPFFDDVQAILFLAPLVYHQMLEEDPKVNRLEDSLLAWQGVCKNKLLANTRLILFFNKKDVVKKALDQGIPVNKYVLSYGDLPNDIEHVTKYFKDRFLSYQKKLSPKERSFYCYETSAIDTPSMRQILLTVHDGIFRASLGNAGLL